MSGTDGGKSDQPDNERSNKPVTIYDLRSSQTDIPLRRLPSLIAQALRLVWAAAPGEFLLVTGLQAASGLGLVVPILAGRDLLATVAGGNGPGTVPEIIQQVVIVLVVGLAVALLGAIADTRDVMLSELVSRYAQQRILDVTCAVELEAFETPAFHDRLQRASMSAPFRPYQLVQGLVRLGAAAMGIAGVCAAPAALEPLVV